MASKTYGPISKAKFRCERAARDWSELVTIVTEAAKAPGYSGPSPHSVERIAADITATRQTLLHWLGTTALAGRPGRLSGAKVEAIREVLGQRTAAQ